MLSVASKTISVGLQDVVSVVCGNNAELLSLCLLDVVVAFADVASCCHHCCY